MHEMLQGYFGGRRRMSIYCTQPSPYFCKQATSTPQTNDLQVTKVDTRHSTIAPRLGLKTNVYQQIQYQQTIFVSRAISTTLTSNKKLATSGFISLVEEQHGVKEFYFLFISWITHLKKYSAGNRKRAGRHQEKYWNS